MSREVRMVPKGYIHPMQTKDICVALLSGYKEDSVEFLHMANEEGLQEAVDYMGCPDQDNYMQEWPEDEKTHCMMFETTTEGTPISPAFETPEELAKWLYESGASAFGGSTGTYEGWLRVAKGGFAPSAVIINGVLDSGVNAIDEEQSK